VEKLATEIWGSDITSEAVHRDLNKKSSKNKKNRDKRFVNITFQ